jgi:hypothetical protein
VHDVDLTLVVGIALLIANEVSEIAAHREDRVDARHLDDLVGILDQRLNNASVSKTNAGFYHCLTCWSSLTRGNVFLCCRFLHHGLLPRRGLLQGWFRLGHAGIE